MAIPRKPKTSPIPETMPVLQDPGATIAEALAPVDVPAAAELLTQPAAVEAAPAMPQPAEVVAAAEKASADFQALFKENTDKAVAEAKAAQERLRAAAEQGMEQTRAAYAKMKAAAEEATSSLESSYAAAAKGWTELNSKAIDLVKANADAHFEHVKAVFAAKSVPEVFSLQTAHMKARFDAANEQIKDLASTAQKIAAEAGEPIKAILSKRFAA